MVGAVVGVCKCELLIVGFEICDRGCAAVEAKVRHRSHGQRGRSCANVAALSRRGARYRSPNCMSIAPYQGPVFPMLSFVYVLSKIIAGKDFLLRRVRRCLTRTS